MKKLIKNLFLATLGAFVILEEETSKFIKGMLKNITKPIKQS